MGDVWFGVRFLCFLCRVFSARERGAGGSLIGLLVCLAGLQPTACRWVGLLSLSRAVARQLLASALFFLFYGVCWSSCAGSSSRRCRRIDPSWLKANRSVRPIALKSLKLVQKIGIELAFRSLFGLDSRRVRGHRIAAIFRCFPSVVRPGIPVSQVSFCFCTVIIVEGNFLWIGMNTANTAQSRTHGRMMQLYRMGRISRRTFMEYAIASGIGLTAGLAFMGQVAAQTPRSGGHLRLGFQSGNSTDSYDPATLDSTFNQVLAMARRATPSQRCGQMDRSGRTSPKLGSRRTKPGAGFSTSVRG